MDLKYFTMSKLFKNGSNKIKENSKNFYNKKYRTQIKSVKNALQNEKNQYKTIFTLKDYLLRFPSFFESLCPIYQIL